MDLRKRILRKLRKLGIINTASSVFFFNYIVLDGSNYRFQGPKQIHVD